MDYRSKLLKAAELIKTTGLDYRRALTYVGMTREELEQATGDEEFMSLVTRAEIELEIKLLKRHDSASKKAEAKGNASHIQWKLSHMNPEKWGDRTRVNIENTPDFDDYIDTPTEQLREATETKRFIEE